MPRQLKCITLSRKTYFTTAFINLPPSGGLVRSRPPLDQGLRGAMVHHAFRNSSQLAANIFDTVSIFKICFIFFQKPCFETAFKIISKREACSLPPPLGQGLWRQWVHHVPRNLSCARRRRFSFRLRIFLFCCFAAFALAALPFCASIVSHSVNREDFDALRLAASVVNWFCDLVLAALWPCGVAGSKLSKCRVFAVLPMRGCGFEESLL